MNDFWKIWDRATVAGRPVTIEEVDETDNSAWVRFENGIGDWVALEELRP